MPDIKITKRMKIIKGHVGYLERMIMEDKKCADIMTQSLAIQNSLKSMNREFLKNYLLTDSLELIKKDEKLPPKNCLTCIILWIKTERRGDVKFRHLEAKWTY